MKAMFLYGLNSNASIYNEVLNQLKHIDAHIVTYPKELTKEATAPFDLAQWVNRMYQEESFDVVIGHSMGGIIALQLHCVLHMQFKKIILLETNLKPANPFYRNLCTPEHMKVYGDSVIETIKKEAVYVHKALAQSVQENFDYSSYVKQAECKIYGIYGDRNQPDYKDKFTDLCLDHDIIENINFSFIKNSCHMPMIENPQALAHRIQEICKEDI